MIAKPRIERCGNHWCVETFDETRFFSRCWKTFEEAKAAVERFTKGSTIYLEERRKY